MAKVRSSDNRYGGILVQIFKGHYEPGMTSFEFERNEMESAAEALKIKLPKNIGD